MRILVLRALGLGDLAAAVPALRGIVRAGLGDQVVLATPGWLRPVVELIGGIDDVASTPSLERVPAGLHADVAINLHGCGPQSHRVLNDLRPRSMLAFRCPEAGQLAGPGWRQGEHEVHRWCRLLRWYGIPADPNDLDLAVPARPSPLPGVTLLHPGAKDPARRWSVGRFAALARALTDLGHDIRVTGSESDRGRAVEIVRQAGLPAVQSLAGQTDTGELSALVAAARLVISGDTGMAHLATAFRVPSVVLFDAMDPARWGPPDRPYHQVIWHPSGPTRPAGRPSGLASVTVPEVLAAALRADSLSARSG